MENSDIARGVSGSTSPPLTHEDWNFSDFLNSRHDLVMAQAQEHAGSESWVGVVESRATTPDPQAGPSVQGDLFGTLQERPRAEDLVPLVVTIGLPHSTDTQLAQHDGGDAGSAITEHTVYVPATAPLPPSAYGYALVPLAAPRPHQTVSSRSGGDASFASFGSGTGVYGGPLPPLPPLQQQQSYQRQPRAMNSDGGLLDPAFSPPVGNLPGSAAERVTPFIEKLSHILDRQEHFPWIFWDPTGTSVLVAHEKPGLLTILNQYFTWNNFGSMVRQFNMYGFKRVSDLRLSSILQASTIPTSVLVPPPSAASSTNSQVTATVETFTPSDYYGYENPKFFRSTPGRVCELSRLKRETQRNGARLSRAEKQEAKDEALKLFQERQREEAESSKK